MTQSLGTPLTLVTTCVGLGAGGTQRGGVKLVGVGGVDGEVDGGGDDGAAAGVDFEADDEHAPTITTAITTRRAVPTDRTRYLTMFPPGAEGANLANLAVRWRTASDVEDQLVDFADEVAEHRFFVGGGIGGGELLRCEHQPTDLQRQ
jgi:hypothetical protein